MFRDTLTGRKTDLWLTPILLEELAAFRHDDVRRRMLHGGLPPFFLSDALPERDFQERMDAFWSKDVQQLFRVERQASFQRRMELVFANSGGIFRGHAIRRAV